MLYPTTADIIRVIHRTLETVIQPALKENAELSAAVTMGHMLRYLALRVEKEGPMLAEDIARLRSTLDQIAPVVNARAVEDEAARELSDSIKQSTAASRDTRDYRDIAALAAESGALRQSVCLGINFFQSQAVLDDEATQARDALLQYVSAELMQNAELMDPPFEGFGPRR